MKNFTHLKNLFCFTLILLTAVVGNSQTVSQTYNSSNTFTVPAGVTSITVEAWGGGGRGGSRTFGSNGYGGGGGGAYSRRVLAVTPGQVYTVTVGTGANSTAAGLDLQLVNPSSVVVVRAKGGNSVPNNTTTGATGGAAASCIGDIAYNGGNGANGTAGLRGGGGGASAGTANAGANGLLAVGGIGINGGGNGGNGRTGSSGNGSPGNTPGGGGGGALRTSGSPQGGNGANGQMIITYPIPEINITGNALPIADNDATPSLLDGTDFGIQTIGVGATQSFTIQNTSASASLTIGAITFAGVAAGDYAITTPPAGTIPASGSTTFVVTFTASSAGVRNATISIVNNDIDENPYNFALTGTGAGPEIDIQGNAVSIVDGDVTPTTADWTDFGSTSVGVGINRPYTIYNNGTLPLTIGAITFSGLNAADFSVIVPPAAIVAAGGNTTFTVRFNPSAAGVRVATISIVNGDANENPYNFDLRGSTPTYSTVIVSVNWPAYSSENRVQIFNPSGVLIATIDNGYTGGINNSYSTTLNLGCLLDANNYYIRMFDSANDGWDGADNITVTSDGTTVINQDGNSANTTGANVFFNVSGGTCLVEPEIDIMGNAISISDGDTSPSITDWTDFGSTTTGIAITRTFTIQNTGTIPLTIGAISITGVNASEFVVTTPPSASIAPGSSSTFIVSFNPTGVGVRNATISIVNNDTTENPYNFDLRGTGTAPQPEIEVQGNATLIVDGDPTPSLADWTDFGSTDAVSGTITRTFTIRNSGTLTLTIGAFSFTGGGAGDFTLTTPPNPNILPGNSSNFTVTFDPSAVGVRNANLSFVNNDSNENPYNFAIQGTGTEQEIDVQGNLVSIADNDNTPSLTDWTDFGTTSVGIGITRTFTILNTGSATLTVGTINITGGGGEFVLTSSPSATVALGGSTTFDITYTPSGLGADTANISFTNNDSNESPYRFRIQGNGAASPSEMDVQGSAISIVDGDNTPSTLDWTDFAGSGVGSPTSRTFKILNTGTGVLVIGAITFGGPNAGDFTVIVPPSATVAVSGFTTFEVQFTPSAIGVRNATMSIANNDADENPYNFSLQGTGFAALTYGPGGVRGNLQLWFRSDRLNGTTTVADGTAVNTWNTQGRGSNAIRPGSVGSPIYRNNATHNINFNSVVDFTNNPVTSPQNYTDLDPARQYLEGPTGFYSQDIFAVVIPDINVTSATASLDIFCGDRVPGTDQTDGTGIGYGRYTNRFTNEVLTYCLGTTSGAPPTGYGVAHVDGTGTVNYNAAGIINASNNTSINGMNLTFNANNVVNATNDLPDFANVNNSQFWMGRSEGWDGSWDGRIGEIITLSNRATDIERSNIQSYLAIKYGITLGINGTSMNYTNSDGNVIWDATANSGFNYDIAGIGRDDISRLTQKQSRSINPTEVMTIGLGDVLATNTANTNTFATNKSYLVWGANGGNMANSGVPINVDLGPTTITTITEVVNRRWKVVETGGDVGTTRINVPTASFISGLPALGPNDAYVMVVATNSVFTTGVETVFMSTSGSDQTCLYDFDATKFITFGVAHRAVDPLHITLDGSDDFVRIGNANEIGAAFTIMTWIKPNGMNALGNERTILAKKPNAVSGYRLVLQNNNRVRMEWTVGGTTMSAITNTAIPDAKWHNIAVTYNAGTLNMYIDGVLDRTSALATVPVATTANFSIGAQYISKTSIVNLFKGDIDELRMWNRSLSATEIRFIMNQEILQTGTGTTGTIIPTTVTKNDINTLLWNNLFAYYSMNSYIGTHLDDDSVNINRGSLVIPDKISINQQTAPMPYESTANGLWSNTTTWLNGATQDLPYSLSIVDGVTPIDWNIVRTDHNVSSTGNKNLLGLFVDANTLSADNNSKLEVSHYLKIDGVLDLEGRSQLVQTVNSDLDPTSSGSLQRDQQGQNNIYNYNYWSSPVGAINATTNNNAYTVAGVMKDGTTSTPQNITWTTGINGSPTSPITLSSYWIFKFQNLTPAYANWAAVGQNGSLNPGQGYTLKGSGSATDQNYTYVGKPNNGPISSPISANNLNLSGNPYSSAIDANAFLTDNSGSTTGAVYFWEHYATNNTHILQQYQGGYAARNLVGGTPPVSPPGISGLGTSSRIPGRFIPVGQGFFVYGSATGGTINFNNAQRAFVKEDNANSNVMFRNAASNSMLVVDHFNNNEDASTSENEYKKIRLGFNDRNGYHRQILMGFMEEKATSGIDTGYDAFLLDNQPSDMYFYNGGANLNISGEGTFDINSIYPLGIKTDGLGNVTFSLDGLENFENEDDINVYIHDNTTDIYHDIKTEDVTFELPLGVVTDRFSLRFITAEQALGITDLENSNAIQIAYTSSNDMLNIKNNLTDATVEKVELYNMLGQAIGTWSVKDQAQNNIQLPIKNISTATYIVKIKTTKGDTSRKIIIN